MKIIAIPAYRGPNYTPEKGHFMVRELLDKMKERGQLEGVEVDIDDAHPTEHTAETRDEEVLANITPGFLKRVKMYCGGDKYDAIVSTGGMEPGFFASRMISKIPVAHAIHSAVHFASLIGDRFTMIGTVDPVQLIVRRYVQSYGLDHKLMGVRRVERSSSYTMGLVHKYKKEERVKIPEIKNLIDDTVTQCIAGIEDDRADSLILGLPPLQCFEDEIRQKLDEAGYEEIPLISAFPAAVEMAKAMVSMKLKQAPRAYPSDALKAKPKFR